MFTRGRRHPDTPRPMASYQLPQFAIPESVPLMLAGQDPGLLDSTQRTRILSNPSSQLLFASYHPRAGASAYNNTNTTDQGYTLSNRAVIEVLPDGNCLWRLVPLAIGASSFLDEGSWPRLIDICGCVSCRKCVFEH